MVKSKHQNLTSVKIKNFFKKNMALVVFLLIIAVVGIGISINGNKEAKELPYGDDVIEMMYFHSTTCPHCHRQNELNKKLLVEYPNLKIITYEVASKESQDKYVEVASSLEGLDENRLATPTTVIGSEFNVGYGTEETSGVVIRKMISDANQRILDNWDDSKITTLELRAQLLNEQ